MAEGLTRKYQVLRHDWPRRLRPEARGVWEAISNLPDALQGAPKIAVEATDFGVIAYAEPAGTFVVYGVAS